MQEPTSYPAKLMLFGEYTVITGSMALAIPLNTFRGQWVNEERPEEWPFDLEAFLDHLRDHNEKLDLDLSSMKRDLEKGWWFRSDIPTGFGVGSSGSFVAGLLDRYKRSNPNNLRDTLATIESFFHGQSSGLDPLISLTGRSILIGPDGAYQYIEEPDHSTSPFEVWLINSDKPRRTQPLVNLFRKKLKDPDYKVTIRNDLSPLVNNLIENFLDPGRDPSMIWNLWSKLSDHQKTYFSDMIIPEIQRIWDTGLESESFKLKLCGAGGGGFYLSIVRKNDRRDFLSSLNGMESFRVSL